jgi:GTP cyclohydrolase IA
LPTRPLLDTGFGATILLRDHQKVTDSPVDLDAVERAAAAFLTALGIDLDREQRQATPARMARAYAELLDRQPFQLTTFPNEQGDCALVLARAIPFRTLCADHMLLLSGVCHVGYVPRDRIVGLSKLAVRAFGATTVTSTMLGSLRSDYRSRAEFFALADVRNSPGSV